MKRELGIFVDETGDLYAPCGKSGIEDRFYAVSLVFHDKSIDVTRAISSLDERLNHLSLPPVISEHAIHSYNLIRREYPYRDLTIRERKKIFAYMVDFLTCVHAQGVTVRTLLVDRSLYAQLDKDERGQAILTKLQHQMYELLTTLGEQLFRFSEIKIYYDNGQSEISALLHKCFNQYKIDDSIIERYDAHQCDYHLLQASDMACTLTLLKAKQTHGASFTHNDITFFNSKKEAMMLSRRSAISYSPQTSVFREHFSGCTLHGTQSNSLFTESFLFLISRYHSGIGPCDIRMWMLRQPCSDTG